MAGQNYPRLPIEQFGTHLIVSGDLDPIYIALHKTREQHQWPDAQLFRWLLAYWCYYSAGVASYLSEFEDGEHFWHKFLLAAHNTVKAPHGGRWERGKERRHFRGIQAVKATNELAGKYPSPDAAVRYLVSSRPFSGHIIPFGVLSDRVQDWRGFGDWISFKVGDMLERLGIADVQFAFSDAMYKDPTQAALMQWRVKHGAPADSVIDAEPEAVQEIVNDLIEYFNGYKADPVIGSGRAIGYQEVETILCKWKSHVRGHYPLNNDIREIRDGVSPWADHSAAARNFLENMPCEKR
jgi:hypothetical protein